MSPGDSRINHPTECHMTDSHIAAAPLSFWDQFTSFSFVSSLFPHISVVSSLHHCDGVDKSWSPEPLRAFFCLMKTVSNWIWLTWHEACAALIWQEMSFLMHLIQLTQCERNGLSVNEDSVLVIDGHPQCVRTPELTGLTLPVPLWTPCAHNGLNYDFVLKSHRYYIELN